MLARYRILLPVISLAVLLCLTFWMQPRAMSYFGLNLLFNLAVPIALATIAQMMIIMVNDIDLSLGAFVSLVACVTATLLNDAPLSCTPKSGNWSWNGIFCRKPPVSSSALEAKSGEERPS